MVMVGLMRLGAPWLLGFAFGGKSTLALRKGMETAKSQDSVHAQEEETPSKATVVIVGNVDTGKSTLCQWLLGKTDVCKVYEGAANDGSKNTQSLELASGCWFNDCTLGELQVLDTPGFTLAADDGNSWVAFTDYVRDSLEKIDALIYTTNTGDETGAFKQGVVNKLRQSFGTDIWENLFKWTPIKEGFKRYDLGVFKGYEEKQDLNNDGTIDWVQHKEYWLGTLENSEFVESKTDWNDDANQVAKKLLEDEIGRVGMFGAQLQVEPGYHPMISVAAADLLAEVNAQDLLRPPWSQEDFDKELGLSNMTGLNDMRREILAIRPKRDPVGQWDVKHLRPRFGPSEVTPNQEFLCKWPHECVVDVQGSYLSDADHLRVFPAGHVCGEDFAGFDDASPQPVSHPLARPKLLHPAVDETKQYNLGPTMKLEGLSLEYKICYCEYGYCNTPQRFFQDVGKLIVENTKCQLPCDHTDFNAVLQGGAKCGDSEFILAEEAVEYQCILGHGIMGDHSQKTVTRQCDRQGNLDIMQHCSAVQCKDEPPVPANSKRITAENGQKYTYKQPIYFECDATFTTDAAPQGNTRVDIQCGAEGQWGLPEDTQMHEASLADFLANKGCRKWVPEPWGDCDAKCGAGKHTRELACTGLNCNTNYQPETESACEDYSGCPDCGMPKDLSSVHANFAYNKDAPVEVLKYGDAVYYDCDFHHGYTLNGGVERSYDVVSFEATCTLDKETDQNGELQGKLVYKRFADPELMTDKDVQLGCRKWDTADWGECSVTCGSGFSFRTIFCSTGNDADCLDTAKPKNVALSRTCLMDACPIEKTDQETSKMEKGSARSSVNTSALMWLAAALLSAWVATPRA